MARAGAYMFFAVGFFALLSLLLSPFPQANVPALAGLVGCAWAMAAGLLVAFDRMPVWGFQVLLAGGTVLASGAVYFSGEGSSTYAFFYLLMVLYAFYFFPRAEALCHLVFVGTAFAWALVALAPPDPVGRWVIAIGTLAMAAHMVSVLRERVEALIGRLSEAARSDALTGVLNRRGFEELLDRELERARRTDQALSVIMVDLDHFKRLNDRLGHGMGDIALRKVAEVLDQGRRHIDTIARLGGEEFAVILPDADHNGAYVLAERLRSNVSAAFLGTRCLLTASFGVASFPEHGRGRSALMESCDQALYAAKELGRDRCVSFGADVAVTLEWGTLPQSRGGRDAAGNAARACRGPRPA